ncbi:MAG: hypothetical protein M0P74_00900 [Syntrophales bacterium]|nr:hypothetical protein [Syntrophales bacterium]
MKLSDAVKICAGSDGIAKVMLGASELWTSGGGSGSGTFYPLVSGDDGMWSKDTLQFNSGATTVGIGRGTDMYFGGDVDYNTFIRIPVTIPRGATIVTCILTLVPRDQITGAGDCPVNIYFNNVDDAVAPTDAPTSEALALTAAVPWNITGTPTISPELKTILQTVVNRDEFTDATAVMLLIKNNESEHAWRIWSLDSGNAALLYVEWS